jgi:hypothetical protein
VRKLSVQQVKQSDKTRLLGQCCHTDPLAAAATFNRCVDLCTLFRARTTASSRLGSSWSPSVRSTAAAQRFS